MPRMETSGSRLKAALSTAKISQTELGETVGRTKGAVSQWVHDQAEPDLLTLGRICAKLKVSADYLVRGVDVGYLEADSLQIANRVQRMAPDSRRALLELILGPAVPDAQVERSLPSAPRRLKYPSDRRQ